MFRLHAASLPVGALVALLLTAAPARATTPAAPIAPTAPTAPTKGKTVLGQKLVGAASRLLDEAQISYVYGGYQVGDTDACKRCNDCLTEKSPSPKERLKQCGICASCSLDCSHFTAMVYKEAGAPYPYLDTKTMLDLSPSALSRRYGLIDLGTDLESAATGDLLVYDGHVVMLERRHAPLAGKARYRGDVVHATGGKDIRRPGEGIQRERFIDLAAFRGPLRRILRHQTLAAALAAVATGQPEPSATDHSPKAAPVNVDKASKSTPATPRRLRPVVKRQPNGD